MIRTELITSQFSHLGPCFKVVHPKVVETQNRLRGPSPVKVPSDLTQPKEGDLKCLKVGFENEVKIEVKNFEAKEVVLKLNMSSLMKRRL